MLAVAAVVALAAESIARATPAGSAVVRSAPVDLDSVLSPVRIPLGKATGDNRLQADPLANRPTPPQAGTVAPRGGVSTVSTAARRGRGLSAILIADQRSVAVIDDVIVGVGDRLPNGARVDAIQRDRVVVVERSGQRRVLTLTTGRQ